MAVEFEPLHDRLTVVPAGTCGGRPMSDPVVQRVWLPIIGPASIVVAAELARGLAACPSGFSVGTADLAARCGLSESMAKHQPLPRTIGRLIRFRFAAWVDPGRRLAVACDAPPLTARMLERVPVSVRSSRSLDLEWDRLRG